MSPEKISPVSTQTRRWVPAPGAGSIRGGPFRFAWPLLAGIVVVGALVAGRWAEAKPPTPKGKPAVATPSPGPAATLSTPASVRFWKTEMREHGAIRVVLTPKGSKPTDGRAVGGGGVGYLFTNYVAVPAGPGTLDVLDGADSRPLVSVAVDFGPESYFTALVMEPLKAGDPPRLEVIEDRDGRTGPAEGQPTQIIVRSLMPDLKDARVSFGDVLNMQFASGTSYLLMNGIAPTTYQVHTAGTTPDGKPFEWTLDADFKLHRRQTLLIYPDSYGRIRPRLSVDGESAPEPPAADPGAQS